MSNYESPEIDTLDYGDVSAKAVFISPSFLLTVALTAALYIYAALYTSVSVFSVGIVVIGASVVTVMTYVVTQNQIVSSKSPGE